MILLSFRARFALDFTWKGFFSARASIFLFFHIEANQTHDIILAALIISDPRRSQPSPGIRRPKSLGAIFAAILPRTTRVTRPSSTLSRVVAIAP